MATVLPGGRGFEGHPLLPALRSATLRRCWRRCSAIPQMPDKVTIDLGMDGHLGAPKGCVSRRCRHDRARGAPCISSTIESMAPMNAFGISHTCSTEIPCQSLNSIQSQHEYSGRRNKSLVEHLVHQAFAIRVRGSTDSQAASARLRACPSQQAVPSHCSCPIPCLRRVSPSNPPVPG